MWTKVHIQDERHPPLPSEQQQKLQEGLTFWVADAELRELNIERLRHVARHNPNHTFTQVNWRPGHSFCATLTWPDDLGADVARRVLFEDTKFIVTLGVRSLNWNAPLSSLPTWIRINVNSNRASTPQRPADGRYNVRASVASHRNDSRITKYYR